MKKEAKSIRPFIGSKDYEVSRAFYRHLGFQEIVLEAKLCLFRTENIGFYLQDYYAKDWVDNTMVFVEVEDVDTYFKTLSALDFPFKFPGSRLTAPREYDWGKECFVHDPCGILWHFGQFKGNS